MVHDSTVSNSRVDPRIIIALAALVAIFLYLMISAAFFRVGFPLDDTWIHLTYARNLAEHGQWAFRLGEVSAASTSPLWTFLLAIGYLLDLAPYIWTYFLGWLVLTLLGIHAENTVRKLIRSYRPAIPWVGLFFVIAWHLTWSAVSGMETLLHGYVSFVVLSMLLADPRRYLALGLLAGLSVWVRPDGLTLLGPLLFAALFVEKDNVARGQAIGKLLISFGALFVPYLLFNLALSGHPMPSTFYAKQAEYQDYWLSLSMTDRLANYLFPIIASPFLVLIPGAFLWLFRMVRERNWGAIAGVLWFLGYIVIYFMRLPAYQHGRYMIPALPVMYLWGMLGMVQFISSTKTSRRIVFIWQALLVMLSLVFVWIAARQNAYDVYWIESEMVGTARWVEKNIPTDALLAVHDIGALGYYVPNPLIDLAGLVTPEVVPFIRNSERLIEYLDSRSADYLIVFPGQYPRLTSKKQSLFVSGLEYDLLEFDDHIGVYRWR